MTDKLKNRILLVTFKDTVIDAFGPMTFNDCLDAAYEHKAKQDAICMPFIGYIYQQVRPWK